MKLPNVFEKDAVPLNLTAGQVIFEYGQARDFMYVVKKGEVDIVVRDEVVETVAEDGFFGEMAIIDHAPRSATAIAKTDCTLFKIEQEAFYELINNRPEIARGFIKILCNRLRQLNQKAAQGSI